MKLTMALALLMPLIFWNDVGSQGQAEDAPNENMSADAAADVLVDRHRAGVVGSKHDFTTPGDPTSNACSACHVPHIQAIRSSTLTTTRPSLETYRIKGQRRIFKDDRYTPGPTSLVCLGCHDGTVATSAVGASHAVLAGVRDGFASRDEYGVRDHPIGIPYPSGDRGYHTQAFVEAKGRVRLPEGKIECVSCHDPHDSSGTEHMLVMSNRRSRMCLSCHVK